MTLVNNSWTDKISIIVYIFQGYAFISFNIIVSFYLLARSVALPFKF